MLDISTINKIAAGEVVERPSSIVKELVDNSIDAGATTITIEIKDGGTSFIKVTDNGKGIPKDEVKTAFLSHATSKITNIDDLENINSLGFRGEALASIASVTQLEMITKTSNEDIGTSISINGGKIIEFNEKVCLDGTSIIVKNIFYNIPVRRKFLKKNSTEAGYISDVVNKFAMGHPEISFKFINNNTVIIHTSGNNDLKTSIFYVYGKEIAKKMIEINFNDNNLSLNGLIGKPEISRGTRSYENLFINGRFIKNSIVSSAVEESYKTRLMVGRFPIFVLNLKIKPNLVDVNVHPTKLEVRFYNDDEIYKFIYKAISNALKNEILITESDLNSKPSKEVKEFIENKSMQQELLDLPNINLSSELNKIHINDLISKNESKDFKVKENITEYKKDKSKKVYADKEIKNPDIFIETNSNIKNNFEKGEVKKFFNNYKIVGQIFNTYWIIEQTESIFIIDQHAAHERIIYENLMNEFKNENIAAQRLLNPILLNLSEIEKSVVNDNLDLLYKFGFEVEKLNEKVYTLNTVPFIFKEPSNSQFFIDILDKLTHISNLYDMKVLSVATIACKAAVKANDKLNFQEAISIVESLLKLENPFTCPHGRPTIIEITKYEMEKKFKRIQK